MAAGFTTDAPPDAASRARQLLQGIALSMEQLGQSGVRQVSGQFCRRHFSA
jgi:hypothetical protein